eukprot:CAMPEP_0198280316 /NCGR_PEP_ID=MMETSP1449-20131203/400_1 /TAXON_ID=420275 /ORGANISM="Attheya septentrionalis, Strain CCMP2084" /LENGTH=448 /DNA_ID=CAMNT_0043975629 /DNA_START=242 /DNA_END=1588 /DNA_ORIENTATION=-
MPENKSWVEVRSDSDFSLQNLPYGVFSHSHEETPRCGSAIGSYAIDLAVLAAHGIFYGVFPAAETTFSSQTLNAFMGQSSEVWRIIREVLINLLEDGGEDTRLSGDIELQAKVLIPLSEVIMHLPADIGDYTDFYSSREHATNVGTMFRGADNALQPNWLHLPVGYHGRASSIFLSGTDVVRPSGQIQVDATDAKSGSIHGPCQNLDFELEMCFFVGGSPNPPGTPILMAEAEQHIFGFTVMNDWSARDLQKWEYVPLGPFTAKNFATTISPWIVSPLALEPFKCPTSAITQTEPVPLEYLRDPDYGSYDVKLEVKIQSLTMTQPETVCRSNFANLYWNAKQQLVHHSVSGCNMRPGDLLGSGTISGSTPDSFGSMLELSWKGSREVKLGDTGEFRKYLQDGDTVIMGGWCIKEGIGRVGFGPCVSKILKAGSSLTPGKGRGTWIEKS